MEGFLQTSVLVTQDLDQDEDLPHLGFSFGSPNPSISKLSKLFVTKGNKSLKYLLHFVTFEIPIFRTDFRQD